MQDSDRQWGSICKRFNFNSVHNPNSIKWWQSRVIHRIGTIEHISIVGKANTVVQRIL